MKQAHELYPIAEWFDTCFDNNEFKKINDTLMNLTMDLDKMEFSIIMRVTYPYKEKLKDWIFVLERIREELYERKENPEIILRGLPQVPTAKDLYPICKWVSNCVLEKKISKIDDALDTLNVNMECIYLLSTIRYTFSVKDRLKNWEIARDRIKEELDRRKLNSEKLLHGLY